MTRPVFILSSGRCGSTLLQRLLNTNPRFAICGEHAGVLRPLAQVYQVIAHDKQLQNYVYGKGNDRAAFLKAIRVPNSFMAWENFFQRDEMLDRLRDFIRSMLQAKADLRWGFKEVRYNGADVLPMLRDLFPEAQYIFLVRHPLDVMTSRATSFLRPVGTRAVAGDADARQRYERGIMDALGAWHRLYDTLFAVAAEIPANCLVLRYEDLAAGDPTTLTGLETFLGEGRFDAPSILRHKVDPAERGGALEGLAASILLQRWNDVIAEVAPTAEIAGYSLEAAPLQALAAAAPAQGHA